MAAPIRRIGRIRAQFLAKEGQLLLPLLDLVERAERAVDEAIDGGGRGTLEAILPMSAPEVAEAVGVSKSQVRREFIEASEEALKALAARRFDALDILILYLDGLVFGDPHVLSAMGLPADLRRCLVTTSIIASPQSGVRQRTRRVTRWRDGAMVWRWAATTLAQTERHFRRLTGYKQLWILTSYLDGEEQVASARKAG